MACGRTIATGFALAALLLGACGDNTDATPDASPDASPAVGQGSEPRADLIITEVSPRGEGPDWIELHNRSAQPIDLCNFFVTDNLDRLDHYMALGGAAPPDPCEPRMLDGRDFIVIDATGTVGPDQAPFKLGTADEVHIVDLSGRAVDSLVYLFSEESGDVTLARVPTETGLFFEVSPSRGTANPQELP